MVKQIKPKAAETTQQPSKRKKNTCLATTNVTQLTNASPEQSVGKDPCEHREPGYPLTHPGRNIAILYPSKHERNR